MDPRHPSWPRALIAQHRDAVDASLSSGRMDDARDVNVFPRNVARGSLLQDLVAPTLRWPSDNPAAASQPRSSLT